MAARTTAARTTAAFVLACSAFLPAVCTGQATSWRVVETIFTQPPTTAEQVDQRIIGEVHPAGEQMLVRIANMGDSPAITPIGWDVGQHTAFRPAEGEDRRRYQRGPQQTEPGTAVQIRDTEIGIWIDSDHPRPRQGDLLPVCPAYWWWDLSRAPSPFQQPGRELSFSFDLKVPTARREGKAEVYVCAHLLLRDSQSGQHFWFGAALFDLREANQFPDTVHVDNWPGGTGLPILFSALNSNSHWLHPGPGSAEFTSKPFTDYRRVDFRVDAQGLRGAIAAMKQRWQEFEQVSSEPADYQLTHFNINLEVFAPTGSHGQLGVALRDIRLELLAPR